MPSMSTAHPLVLLTDFGTKDGYVASMKGVILSIFPQATLVDLTHEVEPQNVPQAAFVLECSYSFFPRGSIFVCVVDPGVGSARRILAAKTRQGIFLAPDNGLLTPVLKKGGRYELRSVTNSRFFLRRVSATFHGRDCFAPTAARLAASPALFPRLGPRVHTFRRLELAEPRQRGRNWVGEILYFDHFGNAFTNITADLLERMGAGKEIRVNVKGGNIGEIQDSYFRVRKGTVVPVVSSSGFLEIAVNHGSAREALKLKKGTPVEIRAA